MRLGILLLVTLLASCTEYAPAVSDTGEHDPDSGSGWPFPDAGLEWPDAGGADASGDAGTPPPCFAGPALIRLNGEGQVHGLGALAVPPGRISLSYRAPDGALRVRVADGASGEQVADEPVEGIGATFGAEVLDYGEDRYLIAGSQPEPAATSALFLDSAAKLAESTSLPGELLLAAARTGEGALVLGATLNAAGERLVVAHRLDPAAAPLGDWQAPSTRRAGAGWDAAFRASDSTTLACAPVSDAAGEWLSLLAVTSQGLEVRKSGEKLANPSAAGTSEFGCRLGLNTDYAAVAFSETLGAARLLWLRNDGQTIAGPSPFLAHHGDAGRFDVAVSGARTALAFVDDSTAMPRLRVRVYPGPGETPYELLGDDGLSLVGASFGRVRLAALGGGFLLAFEASPRAGQTDLIARPITCSR